MELELDPGKTRCFADKHEVAQIYCLPPSALIILVITIQFLRLKMWLLLSQPAGHVILYFMHT